MVSTSIPAPRRPQTWRLLVILAALAGLVVWFVSHNVLRYTQYEPNTNV